MVEALHRATSPRAIYLLIVALLTDEHPDQGHQPSHEPEHVR